MERLARRIAIKCRALCTAEVGTAVDHVNVRLIQNESAPDRLSHGASVEQPSPEVCS